MVENQQKIITKRSHNLRFLLSSFLGGIGFSEIGILFGGFAVGLGLLIGLAQINVWLGLSMLILDLILSCFLIAPIGHKKLYQHILHSVGYIFAIKKLKGFNLEALNKVAEYNDDHLVLTSGQYVKVWSIKAADISLLSPPDRENIIGLFENALKNVKCYFEVIRHEEPYVFDKQTKHIAEVLDMYAKKNQGDEVIAEQFVNFVKGYEDISSDHRLTHSAYYLFVYASDLSRITHETQYQLGLNNRNISFEPVTGVDLIDVSNKELLPGTKETNQAVAIRHVHQKANYLVINDKFVSYLRIHTFPLLVNNGWLFPIANTPGVQMNARAYSVGPGEAIRMLDKAITRAYMSSTKKASEKIESASYLDHFHTLLDMIKNGGQQLKMVTVDFTIVSDVLSDLIYKRNELHSNLYNFGFLVDNLRYGQLNTYRSHLQTQEKKYWDYYGQEMALNSFCSSFPFVPQALNDDAGLFLGFSDMQEPVFFDVKTRDNRGRVSSNCLVLGMTGFGKTYNVSKQLNWLYLNNTRIFIIDPEREYHHLAKFYNGKILSVGKSEATRINPLEIFGGELMVHISLLEQFFRILYPNLVDRDFADWQKIMINVYRKFDINPQTDLTKLTPQDYPTFSDVYAYVEEVESNEKFRSTLNSVLWKLAEGADGQLWNGHSQLDVSHQNIIVFDTHELSSNKNIQNAQIFLMLSFLDKEIKHNKTMNINKPLAEQTWICVAIDEAHLLVNENNTLALEFLFQMTKRIRKYNGILYIISQNVNDFVGSASIKVQSQGIINNCNYQFIHHLAPNDLQDYDNLVSASGRLNDYEKNRISHATQGQCLFVDNNLRSVINIQTLTDEDKAWLKK